MPRAEVHDAIPLAGRTVTAAELRAGLRYGDPPQQAPSISREQARGRSSTAALWPVFREPWPSPPSS